ncbi:MAG: nascent polypeptide-associated complex protein [Thermoplasmata archaeon]
MIPGGRGINPRQLQRMMKQMGINTEELTAEEVIIRTHDKEYRFEKPDVTIVTAQGQKTFQIIGKHDVTSRTDGEIKEKTITIPDEDVKLVAQQANVSEELARKTLEECRGNPAEAIVKLTNQ